MLTLSSFIKRHPLITFLLIAFPPIWITIPLATGNPVLQAAMVLLSTFAPMLAALVVTGIAEGRAGLKALRQRVFHWRIQPQWYVLAAVIPAVCVLAPILFGILFISSDAYQPAPITPANQAVLSAVLIFALLEETGWTGFLLPRLLNRYSTLGAALLLGFLQGIWHLPLWVFTPDLPYTALAGIAYTTAFRVVLVWLNQKTGRSVFIAAIFHAAINAANSLTAAGVKPEYLNWMLPGGFIVAAIVLVAFTGTDLTQKSLPESQTQMAV
jgi:uncharacterized protein